MGKTAAEYTRAWKLAHPDKARAQRHRWYQNLSAATINRHNLSRTMAARTLRIAAGLSPEYVLPKASLAHRRIQARLKVFRKKTGIRFYKAEYDVLVLAQNGLCAVCGRVLLPSNTNVHAAQRECIEHDHVALRVRGLTCASCNTVLGHAYDSPAVLRAAADYLERHSSPHTLHPTSGV